MGNGNPYRDAAAELWPERTASPIAASLDVALRQDPERRAEAERLGRALGVPAEVAEREPDEARRQARLRQLDPLRLYRQTPKTAEALEDPDFAAVAHDDVEALSGLEWLVGRWRFEPEADAGGGEDRPTRFDLKQVAPGALQRDLSTAWRKGQATLRAADAYRRYWAAPEADREAIAKAALDDLASAPPYALPLAEWTTDVVVSNLPFVGATLQQGATRAAQSAAVTGALGAGVAGVGAAPAAGMGASVGMAYGSTEAAIDIERASTFWEQLRAGVDPQRARVLAEVAGTAKGSLELVGNVLSLGLYSGLAKMGRTLAGKAAGQAATGGLTRATGKAALAAAGKRLGQGFVAEGLLEEAPQEAVDVLALWAGTGQAPEAGEAAARILEAGIKGGIAGTAFHGPATTIELMSDLSKARAAERSRAIFEALGGTAQESKTLGRLPQAVRDWIDAQTKDGPAATVWVATDALDQLFQAGTVAPHELEAVLPGFFTRYQEAAQTSGFVDVPMGDWVAHVAGTKAGMTLLDDVKTDPDGFTARQARATLDTLEERVEEEYQRALAEQEGLRDDPAAKLQALLSPMIAQSAAQAGVTLDPAHVAQLAEVNARLFSITALESGVDPVAYFEGWRVRMEGEAPAPLRGPVEQLDLWLDRARALEAGTAQEPGKSLGAFLRGLGGVRDTGGELQAMDAPAGLRRTTGGLDPDEATLQAWEAGYFPEAAERPGPDALLEAIRGELAGQKRYRVQDVERHATDNATAQEVRGYLHQLGLNLSTATNEQLKAVLNQRARGEAEQARLFQEGAAAYREALAAYEAGTLDKTRPIPLGRTPNVLQALGVQDLPVSIAPGVVRKAVEDKHALTVEALRSLPEQLADPIMVFDSETVPGALVVMLDMRDANGDTVVAAVHLEQREKQHVVHRIASVYGKKGAGWFLGQMERGSLRYRHKAKSLSWARSRGLQLPKEATTKGSRKVKVLHDSEVVNREPLHQGEKAPRASISFLDDATLIRIGKSADLSSFLHEPAHLFLRMFGELAAAPTASERVKADFATVRAWLGAKEGETLTREQEEQFARGFEAYFLEGKSPAAELDGVFRRFSLWLKAIYRRLTGLDVELSDEVRGVFDRALATEEEIRAAEKRAQYQPLRGADELMTGAELADYQAKLTAATEEAIRAAEVEALREFTAAERTARKQRRAELTAEVTRAVNARRVHNVARWLSRGEVFTPEAFPGLEGAEHVRLSLPAIREQFGPEILAHLPRAVPPLLSETGVHPDAVAPLFGYASGADLVWDLANATSRPTEILQEVNRRLAEERGSVEEDRGRAVDRAMSAVHNEARVAALAADLRVLYRKSGQTPPPMAALKAAAARIVAEKPAAKAGNFAGYLQAEIRHARAAQKALDAKDYEAAAEAKRRQVLNHLLAREAMDARDEARKAFKYLGDFRKADRQQRVDPEALGQVLRILQSVGLAPYVLPQQLEGVPALAAWLAELRAGKEDGTGGGFDADVAEWIEAGRGLPPGRELTLAELRDVRDAVKSILHAAKLTKRLLTTGENLDAAAIRLAAEIRKHWAARPEGKRLDPTVWENLGKQASRVDAEHLHPEFLFRRLDGGADNGPVWTTLFRTIADAEGRELDDWKAAQAALDRIFGAEGGAPAVRRRVTERLFGQGVMVPEAGGLVFTRARLITVALNWGNFEGRRELLRAGFTGQSVTEDQVLAVLRNLTPEEWRIVNEIHAWVNTYWPRIAEQQREMTGIAPGKVEALPIVLDGKQMGPGGYYRLKYDPNRSEKTERNEEKATKQSLLRFNYLRPVTRKGHTKARVGGGGQVVRGDLGVLYEHVQEVLHDLSFRKAVLDVDRLLNHPEIQSAIVETQGREVYRVLRPWLQNIASDMPQQTTGWERLLNHFRSTSVLVALGGRLLNAAQQVCSMPAAGVELGLSGGPRGWWYLSKAALRFYRNPFTLYAKAAWAMEQSPLMRHRMQNFSSDARAALGKFHGQGFRANMAKAGFWLFARLDMASAVPSWYGGYALGLEKFNGDHGEAVAFADSIVRRSHPTGMPKDLALVEHKNAFWKHFATYYSQMGVIYNQLVNLWKLRGAKMISFPVFFAGASTLLLSQAILPELIMLRGPDDDEDESWAGWALKKAAFFPLQTVVGLRDVVSYYETGRPYELSPAVGAVNRLLAAGGGVVEWAFTDEEWDRALSREVFNVPGYLWGVPTRAAWDAAEAFWDFQAGETSPGEALLQGVAGKRTAERVLGR